MKLQVILVIARWAKEHHKRIVGFSVSECFAWTRKFIPPKDTVWACGKNDFGGDGNDR